MTIAQLSRFFRPRENVRSYSYISRLYDHVVSHVDYEKWADYVDNLFCKYGNGINRLVDGGCGTGSMAVALVERGYRVAGFDFSYEMVEKSRGKGLMYSWQGDLKHQALTKGWDAFVCLFDTIQYLSSDEIKQCLSQIWQILREGGLFLFDAVTEHHVLEYWADYFECEKGDDWEVLRRGWYDREKRNQHTEFEITFSNEKKIIREHHLQNIYQINEFEAIIDTSGFTCIGLFHEFTERVGGENSDRVHFLLRKDLV